MQFTDVKGTGLDHPRWDSSVSACRCRRCGHSSRIICIREECACCDLEDQFSLMANVDAESVVGVRRQETA